jgi:16S rRNA (guanine527-N7)-methyltransferase
MGTQTRDQAAQDAMLRAFAAAVRASPHNLLSQRALAELEDRHIAECRSFAASLPDGSYSVLDVGTGGGFPGMVIAITRPELDVTLLDATAKKISFLQDFAEEQQLSVTTLNGRAEELQQVHAARFDVVTARAVAPLERLVGWTLPFLRPGGTLHAIKGERWRSELQAALPILQRHRAQVVDVPRSSQGTDTPELGPTPTPRVVIIQAAG